MRVALVHDWLTGMRGGEKCLEPLCRRFPEATLYTLVHAPGSTSRTIEQMRITTSFLQRFPGASRWYRYLLPLMPAAIERLRIEPDVDLVVSLSHAVAKNVIPPPGVPHVCYCFTPMRYAWDLREEYFGRTDRGAARWIRAPHRAARDYVLDRIRSWDRSASQRVTRFVAISREIAERIERAYGRTSDVIYPPVDTRFYSPSEAPREEFYLCVSALAPYKRIDLAIEACNRLQRPLRVVGSGPERRRLQALAGPTVELLGWRDDHEIRELLRRCRALLFPGHEDFGIVPVEAQACGAPVVALGRGGATETLASANETCVGTARFFDRPEVESLIEAMLWLEQNPQQVSPGAAREQALRFTAERFERELLCVLESYAPRTRPSLRARRPTRQSASS